MSAEMVDITDKEAVVRTARARGFIRLRSKTIEKIRAGEVPKGDVLTVAKTAAIMGVKRVPELIPLAHPISITGVKVETGVREEGIELEVEVKSSGKTGVEMEALVGVSIGLLTIWDMVKGLEKDESGQYPTTSIEHIRVVEKVKK